MSCSGLGVTEGTGGPITMDVVLPDCTALRLRYARSTTFDDLRRHVAEMRMGSSAGASEVEQLRAKLRSTQRQFFAVAGTGAPGSSGGRTWADVASGSV